MMQSTQSSDKQLIQGCLAGKRSAQKLLYEKFYGNMLVVCMRYARDRDEATEILNDAFLKVFKEIGKFREDGPLGAWIRRITLFTAIDFARSQASYKKLFDLESEQDEGIENTVLDALSAEEILALLQELPAASRNIFSLYVIEGYSHPEIADILSISVGTSKWHLAHARKQLQELLKRQGIIYSI